MQSLPARVADLVSPKARGEIVQAFDAKIAVIDISELTLATHTPFPTQLPPTQWSKLDPGDGTAVNVTEDALGKVPAQVGSQMMPDGLLVMLPMPVPLLAIVSVTGVNIFSVYEPTPEVASIV